MKYLLKILYIFALLFCINNQLKAQLLSKEKLESEKEVDDNEPTS